MISEEISVLPNTHHPLKRSVLYVHRHDGVFFRLRNTTIEHGFTLDHGKFLQCNACRSWIGRATVAGIETRTFLLNIASVISDQNFSLELTRLVIVRF